MEYLVSSSSTSVSIGVEVPSLVSDFVSWDSSSLVARHNITHSCKIPPLSIHE